MNGPTTKIRIEREVRDMALTYNADYPEAFAEIETGEVIADVSYQVIGNTRLRVITTLGILVADGFIGAAEPDVAEINIPRTRGAGTPLEILAARCAKRTHPKADIRIRPNGQRDYITL